MRTGDAYEAENSPLNIKTKNRFDCLIDESDTSIVNETFDDSDDSVVINKKLMQLRKSKKHGNSGKKINHKDLPCRRCSRCRL